MPRWRKAIGPCLHGNRYHCWHVKIDYPRTIIWECCLCHKRKRTYKPGFRPGHRAIDHSPAS